MSRIHEVTEPKLKTLFRFNVPKPRDTFVNNPQVWQQIEENALLTVWYHDNGIIPAFEDNLPSYIVRVIYPSIEEGYVNLNEEFEIDDKWPSDFFNGGVVMYELSPMYDKAEAIDHLYSVLRALGEQFAEEKGLEVDWNRDYAFRGAHANNLRAKVVQTR